MKTVRLAITTVAATIVATTANVAWSEAPADTFPNGCVGCHVKLTDGTDFRLPAILDEVGHRKLGNKVNKVPTDCLQCHSDDDDPTFAETIHLAHFGEADSDFQQDYNGDCRHCHAMDSATGDAKVKEGDRNW